MLLSAPLVMTGCGSSGGSAAKSSKGSDLSFSALTASGDAADTKTFKIWCAEEDKDLMDQIVSDFESENPDFDLDVKFEYVSESAAKDKILSDVDNAPDVFTFADDQLNALVAAGVLEPVDNDDVKSRNSEGSVAAASIDDNMYAYPLTADNGYFLYYDKSVLSDSDVETLDGILKKCASEGKKMTMDLSSGWYLYAFFGNTGLKLELNDDGLTNKCNWNSKKNDITGLEVAKAILNMTNSKGFENGGDDVLSAGAADGSVAAGVSGVWEESALKSAWGDNMGAVKLPTYTVDGQQVQMASFSGYKLVGVNSMSANVDWAEKFADFMSNEDNQTLRFTMRGQGPSNTKAAESSDVQQSVSIAALLAQSDYAQLQHVGNAFWTPTTDFGNAIVDGGSFSDSQLQKLLDTMAKGITAAVSD